MLSPRLLAALLLLGSLSACTSSEEEPSDEPAFAEAGSAAAPDSASRIDSVVAIADRSRILGDSGAPVWVVIVSDFQCPFCKVWHDQTFPQLKREFVDRGRIRVAYLNLPLPQHQHARATAEMALCAGAQGRFWEFHDAIFDTQDRWSGLPSDTRFFADSVAATARVDQAGLRACMEAGTMRALVEADYQRSVSAKVRSTPTFFVGERMRLEGAVPFGAFRDSLNKVLRTEAPGAR